MPDRRMFGATIAFVIAAAAAGNCFGDIALVRGVSGRVIELPRIRLFGRAQADDRFAAISIVS